MLGRQCPGLRLCKHQDPFCGAVLAAIELYMRKICILSFISALFAFVAIPVYAADSCHQILTKGSVESVHSTSKAARSVPYTIKEISKAFEERVYAVHITKFLPTTGFIKAAKGRGRFLPTIHFSLGEPVLDHAWGAWSHVPYAIVMPVTHLRDQMLNLYPQDTFVLGDVKVPRDAVIFIPEGEQVPSGITNRVIRYNAAEGVKSAISKFLKESNSVEFSTKSARSDTKLGNVNIMEGKRLQRIFRSLFDDKPYLTRTIHAATPWGKIDWSIVMKLERWVNKQGSPKDLDFDVQLALYEIHDAIYGVSSVAAKMTLPDYARKNLSENFRELKSYLTLLEVENYLRLQGSSILALDSIVFSTRVDELLALRYDRSKLFAYVESMKKDLPPAPQKGFKRTPDEYLIAMPDTPMHVFKRRLEKDFANADLEIQNRIHVVIAKHAFNQLFSGKITADQAFAVFKNHSAFLTTNDMTGTSRNSLYNVVSRVVPNSDMNFGDPPNRQVLLFLGKPEVDKILQERNFFQYHTPQKKAEYDKKLEEARANPEENP